MTDQVENKLLTYTDTTIVNYYQSIQNGGNETKETSKYIEGLLMAILLTGIASKQELQELIDEWHFDVFKATRAERRQNKAISEGGEKWNYFDIPTVLRDAEY